MFISRCEMSTSRCGVAATPPPSGGQPGANTIQILVTHVAKFHGLIKIFGQNDFSTGLFCPVMGIRFFQENGSLSISPEDLIILAQGDNFSFLS